MNEKQFPSLEKYSLLVHIAFHFVRDRIQYLTQVLNATYQYPFRHIEIVIDTNTDELDLASLPKASEHITIRLEIHREMDHPFLLTWQHRPQMLAQLDQHDYFMYIEDDIVVSSNGIKRWHEDSIDLYFQGYIRGFIRTEITRDGTRVSTDQYRKTRLKNIRSINGKPYYLPQNPYQGFWIYSKEQMGDFINSSCWKDGNCDWSIRERASAGMTWITPAPRKNNSNSHGFVIPLNNQLKLDENVLVDHAPNNYALDEDSKFGVIPVKHLTQLNYFDQLRYRLRRNFS
ncbi:MAG: hypothetical protein JKX83_11865 [Pseudomonadales bacterium]|nr:hypothetical protein [Pseudomonadales bacterium]